MRCAAATIPGQHAGTEAAALRHGIRTFAAIALLLLATPAAPAGPWPRDDGAVFLSLSVNAEDADASLLAGRFDADPTVSVYGELGLGNGFTAGLELDWGTSSEMGTVFARYTLTAPQAPFQMAVDAGISRRALDGRPDLDLLRLGGAIGTSFDGGDTSMIAPGMLDGGGWMTLDGAAFLASDGTLSIWRSEATLGLHVTEDLRAILALKAEEWPGSTAALTLRPSIVLRVSDRISLQTGVTAGLRGSDTFGLSLSLWQEF